jgi:hypothetical protein
VIAPAPVVSTSVVTAPVVSAPVVTYRPVISSYSVPYAAPYTAGYAAPYVAARPVIVSPKYYVPGQPVRNALRAVTP